ncbi:hypothetical protein GCM10028791_37220 [Echinicola sediminis]
MKGSKAIFFKVFMIIEIKMNNGLKVNGRKKTKKLFRRTGPGEGQIRIGPVKQWEIMLMLR